MAGGKTQRSVGLSRDVIDRIEKLAKEQGRTWAGMVRVLIERGLKK